MRIKGNRMSLFVQNGGYKPIGLAMDATLDINGDVVEMASLSSRAKSFKAGRYGWRMSCEALYCADGSASSYVQQLHILTQFLSGYPLRMVLSECEAVGGTLYPINNVAAQYEGDVLVTAYRVNVPVNGYANISIELQGTGELLVGDSSIEGLTTNNLVLTSTATSVSAVASYAVASRVQVVLGGLGVMEIAKGSRTGSLTFASSPDDRVVSVSVSPSADDTYKYVAQSNILVPRVESDVTIDNYLTLTASATGVTAMSSYAVDSSVTVSIGSLGDIVIAKGGTSGSITFAGSTASRTEYVTVSPTEDSKYRYVAPSSVYIPSAVTDVTDNPIAVTATSTSITATATYPVTSAIEVSVVKIGTVTIPVGSKSATIGISPTSETRTANVSVYPTSDSTYRYLVQSTVIVPGQKEVNEMTVEAYPSYAIFTFAKPVASQMRITVQSIGTADLLEGMTQSRLVYGEETFARTLSLTVSPAEDDEYIYDAPSTIVIPANTPSQKEVNYVTPSAFIGVDGNTYLHAELSQPAANYLDVYFYDANGFGVSVYVRQGKTEGSTIINARDTELTINVTLYDTDNDKYEYVLTANTVTIPAKSETAPIGM